VVMVVMVVVMVAVVVVVVVVMIVAVRTDPIKQPCLFQCQQGARSGCRVGVC
jgi:hypothetical protein